MNTAADDLDALGTLLCVLLLLLLALATLWRQRTLGRCAGARVRFASPIASRLRAVPSPAPAASLRRHSRSRSRRARA